VGSQQSPCLVLEFRSSLTCEPPRPCTIPDGERNNLWRGFLAADLQAVIARAPGYPW